MTKKTALIIFSSVLLLVLVLLGIYFIKSKKQAPIPPEPIAPPSRQSSEKLTYLGEISFSSPPANLQIGQNFDLQILVDTKGEDLATLKVDLNYDPQVLQATAFSFNTDLLPQPLKPVELIVSGKITGSAGVAPTKPVNGSAQSIATVSFKVLNGGSTQITFGPETIAYPISLNEKEVVNLLTQKKPIQITINSL